jgi:hypothetical protein
MVTPLLRQPWNLFAIGRSISIGAQVNQQAEKDDNPVTYGCAIMSTATVTARMTMSF